jgi:hypothetical protein
MINREPGSECLVRGVWHEELRTGYCVRISHFERRLKYPGRRAQHYVISHRLWLPEQPGSSREQLADLYGAVRYPSGQFALTTVS